MPARLAALAAVLSAVLTACARSSGPDVRAVRLTDAFEARLVEGSVAVPPLSSRRNEWRFDGPPPSPPAAAPPGPAATAGPPRPPAAFPATRGWEAGTGITGLAIRDGHLVGRTTTEFPILRVERTAGLDNADQLHAVEIRMRISKGSNLSLITRAAPTIDFAVEAAQARGLPWFATTPLMAGDAMQTYTIRPPISSTGSRIRHLLIRPTDEAGAVFAIESVRLVFRREHLTGVKSGVSWQGLRDIFRETLVTRAPETVRFTSITLPSRPLLDLSVGTPEEAPVTFRVTVGDGKMDAAVLTHTVTTAHRWERRTVDLSRFAGATVTLTLAASAARNGTLAFWGAPAVRQRAAPKPGPAPQVVLLVQGDTLRPDHLEAYGYERPTAPTLKRMAEEGALFRHAITQTGWTKAATPAIMTSLFPATHGVHKITDRLPASATTIAEVYRQAGYATLSFSAVPFTGHFTSLHQGFEELHELESAAGRTGPPRGTKTAREYVDRLVEWLDGHADVPVFVYLHFMDPHAPYEPNRPFDTVFADPKGREEYMRQLEVVKKVVPEGFLAQRGMATAEELARGGIDAAAFLRYAKDWYDGSIRGMDTELARLIERLETLGLRDRSLVAFYSDHGEEFHDHGRMFHGQSVYGEMIRVPLILWAPGHVPQGLKVEEPVQLVDLMPTLLDLSGLAAPAEVQGQSLRPLLATTSPGASPAAPSGWTRRPLFAEKNPSDNSTDFPSAAESYAVVDAPWKLIHNVVRPPEKPEFELYDFYQDRLDQRNVAVEHPDQVARLAKVLAGWRQWAQAARLKPDSEATKGMSAEQLEQLRSLGYIK